jgi:hypothetical protein
MTTLPTVDAALYESHNGPMTAQQRGAEVGLAMGAITAAGLVNNTRYSTSVRRTIRLRVAGKMLGRTVESFNELSDAELRGVNTALIRYKNTVAEWLCNQDFEGQPVNG